MQYLRNKPRPGTQLNLSHPLNKGLVGCWLMNEGSGIRAFDSSPYKNHGTLTNMAIPSCRSSQGLALDGVDDYVNVPNAASLNIADAITIEAWVNILSNQNYAGVVSKTAYSDPNIKGYELRMGVSNAVQFRLGDFTDGGIVASSTITYGQWTHLVGTWNGSVMRLYKNGVLSASTNYTRKIVDSGAALTIAKLAYSGLYINGTIDEVRIYNRALSASEIQLLYLNPYCMFMNVHGES